MDRRRCGARREKLGGSVRNDSSASFIDSFTLDDESLAVNSVGLSKENTP
jgi:hypothetical protein